MIKRHSKYVSRETFLLCLFLTHKFRKNKTAIFQQQFYVYYKFSVL